MTKYSNHFMNCPCCGHRREIDAHICTYCGARRIDEPLAPPDIKLPRLGPAFVAGAIPILVLTIFTIIWLFGNDMKVVRVLLVTMLGESTQLTSDWLRIDPDLLSYRIFSYDAYRLAFYLSAGLIPLSMLGMWCAYRAWQLIRDDSTKFGGLRLAQASCGLSLLLLVSFSATAVSSIPHAIERGREKRLAATRATMYQLHDQALQKYYREYGTYPQEFSDLNRISREPLSQIDDWERELSYAPVSIIASKGRVVGFSNYKLISAGPDGEIDTEDDITMIDGVIVSNPPDSDLPMGSSAKPLH